MQKRPNGTPRLARRLPAIGLLAILLGGAFWMALPAAQDTSQSPAYRVDPFWPKPLPTMTDEDGLARQWVTGMVGASCIDSHDHVITVNRGFLPNGLLPQEGLAVDSRRRRYFCTTRPATSPRAGATRR